MNAKYGYHLEAKTVTKTFNTVCTVTEAGDASNFRDGIPEEQRLFEQLLSDYEPAVRPVYNSSQTVVVSFRLSFYQIVDLVSYFYVYFLLLTVYNPKLYCRGAQPAARGPHAAATGFCAAPRRIRMSPISTAPQGTVNIVLNSGVLVMSATDISISIQHHAESACSSS